MPQTQAQRSRDAARRRARIAAAVRTGMLLPEVAAKFGIKRSRVNQVCRIEGVTLGVGGEAGFFAARRQFNQRIAEAAKRGVPRREIAAEFDVCKETVSVVCRRLGVKCPRPRNYRAEKMLAERRDLAARLSGPDGRKGLSAAIKSSFKAAASRAAARLLLTTDLPTMEIAARVGVSHPLVAHVRNKLESFARNQRRSGRTRRSPTSPSTPARARRR